MSHNDDKSSVSTTSDENQAQDYTAKHIHESESSGPVQKLYNTISASSHSLRRKSTAASNAQFEGNEAISRIVTRLESNAGQLGPLEEPIDHESVYNRKATPFDNVNEQDPYKYILDEETGIRLVEFVKNDKDDPRNWPAYRKWLITVMLGLLCFDVAFCSSVITGAMGGPVETFGVSMEVSILAVTLFVVGFGVGPIVFSPASEEVGRQFIYNSTLLLGVIFIIPCAVAPNIGTLLVCRFIDGVAFSAPMTLIGGSLSDIFLSHERGAAMAVFSAAPFAGPIVGPIVGGFVGDNAGWRWNYWVSLIFSGVIYVLVVLIIPETHHQTILKRRRNKLIKLTNDPTYKIIKDLKPRSYKKIAVDTVTRPFILLTEIIVLLVTIYMSVIYGLLYMFFFTFPVVFNEGKGWTDSMTGLMFIGVGIGVVIATGISPYVNRDYNRRAGEYIARGEIPPPELRLITMMFTCWLLPIGLFIFAWTSYSKLIWVGPAVAGIPCGIGFLLIYNSANNYIVDSYQHYAASALAAKTLVRSLHGATCVLYTIQMLHRLGNQWGISLLAFISLACCAIPYLFFFYGATIRKKSKYAYKPDPTEFFKNRAPAPATAGTDEEKN